MSEKEKVKKILLLFFSAFLSFMVLSYVDEYETLIPQFLPGDKAETLSAITEKADKEGVRDFLLNFNRALSSTYLSSEPSKLSELPLSDNLKRDIMDEIRYQSNKGHVMGLILKEMEILKVNRLSPLAKEVTVKEKVEVSTRNKQDNRYISSPVEVEYDVKYILISGSDGLVVSSFEIVSLEGFSASGESQKR